MANSASVTTSASCSQEEEEEEVVEFFGVEDLKDEASTNDERYRHFAERRKIWEKQRETHLFRHPVALALLAEMDSTDDSTDDDDMSDDMSEE